MFSRVTTRFAPALRRVVQTTSRFNRVVAASSTVAPTFTASQLPVSALSTTRSITTSRASQGSGSDASSSQPSVAQSAADAVRERLPPGFKPRAGLVLGSGLGGVAEIIEDAVRIPYGDIGFPQSTVSGHAGELVVGKLEGVDVVALKGRVHLYEGVDPQLLRLPMYTMKLLGCEVVFLTSAVGSTRPEVGPGELVAVTDHINMQMRNVLIGPNDDAIGTRFPSLMNAYDPVLRAIMHEVAVDNSIRYTDGVFLATLGPSFETPAEIRAFRTLGADVVGMSMIPEVTAARHAGLRVSATGVVVNLASGMTNKHITHDETIYYSDKAAASLTTLLKGFLRNERRW